MVTQTRTAVEDTKTPNEKSPGPTLEPGPGKAGRRPTYIGGLS